MSEYNFTKSDFIFDQFFWEISEELRAIFSGFSKSGDDLILEFSDVLTEQQEDDLGSFVAAHPLPNRKPRIYNCVTNGAELKHFHNINYTIEANLFPLRSFEFGALTQVIWYQDEELTTPVIQVEMEYDYDPLGFATGRITTRKWYLEDGTFHPNIKITEKDYTINSQDQLDEAIQRRTNNIRQTNLWLIKNAPAMTELDVLVTDRNALEIRDDGVSFYEAHSEEMTVYLETGSQNLEEAVVNSVSGNWGEPEIGWFNTNATSLGITGVSTIRDFIIYQLSNGQRNANGTI